LIFPIHHIKLSITNSDLWETENFSIFKVVKKRKYLIQKNQNELYIERKKLDIFDSIGMGFEHIKLSSFAKGRINENEKYIYLEITVKPFYKKFTIGLFSIIYIVPILAFFENWKFGIFIGMFVTAFLVLYLIIWNEIIENFKYELKSDILYFDSDTKSKAQF